MATVEKARSAFGEKLRTELERRDMSIRQFSRMLDPSKPEQARRSLAKWIAAGPPNPSKASRRLVAEALGLEPGHFDEDDEEEDPEMEMLVSALLNRIDRVVEEQLARRLPA
jgi:transcriptional regulator with XRE-family HTH domain